MRAARQPINSTAANPTLVNVNQPPTIVCKAQLQFTLAIQTLELNWQQAGSDQVMELIRASSNSFAAMLSKKRLLL